MTRVSPKEMTAIEVRNALEESSNSEDFSVSLSACHAALKRMLSDEEVEAGPLRNGKATYRRILKLESLTNLAALAGLTWGKTIYGFAEPVLPDNEPPHLPSGKQISEPPSPPWEDAAREAMRRKKK